MTRHCLKRILKILKIYKYIHYIHFVLIYWLTSSNKNIGIILPFYIKIINNTIFKFTVLVHIY